MRKIKLTIIGSGSTYTPELISGLIEHKDSLPVSSIYLMDIDAGKNEIVAALCRRMLDHAGLQGVQTVITADIADAVQGADYIVTQIRVGGLNARILDEKIPLRYGLLGQETTGVGGFMKGMRTIPVMLNYARVIESLAPDAILINFTNPSGMITEMLLNYTKVKAIGLCNSPINMIARAKSFFGVEAGLDYDFVGLNHLCYMTAIYVNGEEKLQALIDKPLEESGLRNLLSDEEYDDELLRTVRAIPSSYLQYFYFRAKRQRHAMLAKQTRGEVCKGIEEELLSIYREADLSTKPLALNKRGGSRYSEAAISLMDAIENDLQNFQTVDVRNGGALPFLDASDVVEIKCRVGRNGAVPQPPVNYHNDHITGLVQSVKAYEKLAVSAGVSGNYSDAIGALITHPLVGDYALSKAVLDEMLSANAVHLPQFRKVAGA